jgi:hypothetical protein
LPRWTRYPRPARIELYAAQDSEGVEVRVETVSLQESESPVFAGDERPVTWEDVEVLAESEGVHVRVTTAPTVFRCRFRRHPA